MVQFVNLIRGYTETKAGIEIAIDRVLERQILKKVGDDL